METSIVKKENRMDNKGMEFITVAVTAEQKEAIRRAAESDQRDISKLVRAALDTWAKANGFPPFFLNGGTYKSHYNTESVTK
jgi:hypothetical protein